MNEGANGNALPDIPAYRQRPKPIGYDLAYQLEGDVLVVDSTRKVDRVRLAAVETVRFTYEPRNVTRHGFRTTLTLKDGRRISFTNLSWKSLMDCEQRNEPYKAFVHALSEAVARANPACRFIGGKNPVIWWMLGAITALSLVGLAAFSYRAFTQDATAAAFIGLVLLALTVWQMEPIVRRNKPRRFAANAIPAELMP